MRTDEDVLAEYTRRRLAELEMEKARAPEPSRTEKGVAEIEDEALLLRKTKRERLVVHFYDRKFRKCAEMTRGLEELAPRFPHVQFVLAQAKDFPFITEKLEISQLPYLATFSNGYFIGGVIGFQDMGDTCLDIGKLQAFLQCQYPPE